MTAERTIQNDTAIPVAHSATWSNQDQLPSVCVVIPCFRCRGQILGVLQAIPDRVQRIFVVDDACPDRTGQLVTELVTDPRVVVISHPVNQGVGGAMVTGYRAALKEKWEIIVKLDGDGQMDPAIIESIIYPIEAGLADYAKGNRFFFLESLQSMPLVRLFGNAALSFVSKVASGYWNVMDPTNGFTAIHRTALAIIPLEKIAPRYFFESDMLFRLNLARAVVRDVPMDAKYGAEVSNLSITRVMVQFPLLYSGRAAKRIFYTYFLRDFSFCSLQLVAGVALFFFGAFFGVYHWWVSSQSGVVASTGTVMVASLPVILGVQFLLAAIGFDMSNVPSVVLQKPERCGIDLGGRGSAPLV